MSELVTIPLAEAAQMLGLSWDRAWRLVLQGRLRGEKKGGTRWVVTAESVEAWKNQPNAAA